MVLYCVICVLLVQLLSAQARLVQFKNVNDDGYYNWNNASSWDIGDVPQSGDNVVVLGSFNSSAPTPTLVIDSPVTITSLSYEGNIDIWLKSTLRMNNFTFGVGFINGSNGAAIVTNNMTYEMRNRYYSALYGVNISVSSFFSNSGRLLFMEGSYLTLEATANAIIYYGTFETDDVSTNIGFINYGTIQAAKGEDDKWDIEIPSYMYGSLSVAASIPRNTPFNFTSVAIENPVVVGGNIAVTDNRDFYSYQYSDFRFYFDLGVVLSTPVTIPSSATFTGGLVAFETLHSICQNGCLENTITLQERTSSIGDGIIVGLDYAIFNIAGRGVVIEKFAFFYSIVTGRANLTVSQARNVYLGQLNGTSIIVTSNFSMEDDMIFTPPAKLLIEPSATLVLYPGGMAGQNQYYRIDDSGIYNYGTTIVQYDPAAQTQFTMGFYNFGSIRIQPTAATANQKGGIFYLFDSTFKQSDSGRVYLNVFSPKDSDHINFLLRESSNYSGILHFNFQYTPSANDFILISQSFLEGYTSGGTFVVETSNLPTGLVAVIFYDLPGSWKNSVTNDHYLAICSANNQTCADYQRGKPIPGTTTTSNALQRTPLCFLLLATLLALLS